VSGGIVKNVQEHLLRPFRISGDEGYLIVGGGVVYLQPGLTQKLAVGKKRVLQLRRNIHQLYAQIEAPVLNAGEFQKLLDHAGEAVGLLGDDLYALHGVAGDGGVEGQSLAPAGDGRQRCAQLVGNLRYKLCAHLVGCGDLFRHLVYLVGELTDLVVVEFAALHSVAAVGNVAG